MTQAEFPSVEAIGAVVHVTFPEAPAIVADRHGLYPAGCLVLCGAAGIIGYAVSHPWLFLHRPKLDTVLGQLPIAVWDYLASRLEIGGHAIIAPRDRYVGARPFPA